MLERFLFLLLLNFDAFLTGMAFGIARVHIKITACCVIAAISALFFGLAMGLGIQIMACFPFEILSKISFLFLMAFTLYLIWKYCSQSSRSSFAGLWRQPEQVDNNADKKISAREAIVLGIALALDSLGGGLAFGLLRENIGVYTMLSGICCMALLFGANRLGQYIINNLTK